MAEFKITKYSAPGAIAFNYEELKTEIEEKAKIYATLVYTEENMAEAKQDKANLNKLKKALNDERIKQEKLFMEPFADFKAKVAEIIAIIDKPVGIIDRQLKEYDNAEKSRKQAKIDAIWQEQNHPGWLSLEQIQSEKWLNKSTSEKAIREEMTATLAKIESEITTIQSMQAFSFEALEAYKGCLDLGRALAEGQRLADIQRRKEEQEKTRAAEAQAADRSMPQSEPEPIPQAKEPEGEWVCFKARLTTPKALLLREFLFANNIEFLPIKEQKN